MDLYVEKQCIDQMKGGNMKQFLALFDANFSYLYKYVARRVGRGDDAERISRLVFLDALGQIQNTPKDTSYAVWLYALAKPRVWDQISRSSFPEKQGLIDADNVVVQSAETEKDDTLERADKIIKKLSLEEREIFRLKFFEEVADGDVMTVLGIEEGTIGSKIYRVLKRAHFLLFGESDERQGVYFGELSGFLSRARELEKIIIPEAFKLGLRADLSGRIDRREFAIETEPMQETVPKEPPVEYKGSNDPAKIFVAAVKEMREEEAAQRVKDELKLDREEEIFDFLERWKTAFIAVPVVLFSGVLVVIAANFFNFNLFGNGLVERGFSTSCKIEVAFKGDFTDKEKRNVNAGVSDKICGHFSVSKLLITRTDAGKVQVDVDVPDWMLEYKFVQKIKDWKINEYTRTLSGNEKSGEVQGDKGGVSRA